MKAKTKEGNQYGSKIFDLTYNSDGEINTSSILDNSLKGPKILDNDSRNLKSLVPFSLKDAMMFLNGEVSDEREINDYATVIYYHEETKMIFRLFQRRREQRRHGVPDQGDLLRFQRPVHTGEGGLKHRLPGQRR